MKNYHQAYTEVLKIISYLPKNEYDMIPKAEIEFYEKNKDKNYNFEFNANTNLTEQKIMRETYAVLVVIYRDYFMNNDQKDKLKSLLCINEKNYQEKLKEKYNSNNIFKNRNNKKIETYEKNTTPNENKMIVYEEGIISKIKKKLKKLFKLT